MERKHKGIKKNKEKRKIKTLCSQFMNYNAKYYRRFHQTEVVVGKLEDDWV